MIEMPVKFNAIKLERTPCYGTCPVYKVSIHHSGRVTYTGYYFVEQTGRHIWYISKQALTELNQQLLKCAYFALQAQEPEVFMTDMPSCVSTVEMQDGMKRTIDHYLQEPDEWPDTLMNLEEEIDRIIGVEKYVGSVDEFD